MQQIDAYQELQNQRKFLELRQQEQQQKLDKLNAKPEMSIRVYPKQDDAEKVEPNAKQDDAKKLNSRWTINQFP